MIPSALQAFLAVLIVSLISFVGLLAISIDTKRLRKVLLLLVSFSAGAFFGDVFLHLLPEAVESAGGLTLELSLAVLAGIVLFFAIEKVVRWQHCHHGLEDNHTHPFAWMNLIGDGVHNFIDGILIGASFLASPALGIATTIAVVLHEIPQEIGDFGVLVHGGFSRAKALLMNFASGLLAIAGVGIALLIGARAEHIAALLVPFAAGGFLYIAGSDLIPELHHHESVKKSLLQLVMFLCGIGVMGLLLLLE
jgi:zinc and cadmium transporter